MNASDADRQIKQMVNFILQEAQEKANEIRIKVRARGERCGALWRPASPACLEERQELNPLVAAL